MISSEITHDNEPDGSFSAIRLFQYILVQNQVKLYKTGIKCLPV